MTPSPGHRPEPLDPGRHAVERERVDLEVARMDEDPFPAPQDVPDGVGDAVAHGERLHVEAPDAEPGVPRDRDEPRAVQPVLREAVAQQPERQRRPVHREVEFLQQERDPPDVVLVPVRQQQRGEGRGRVPEDGEVGDDVIDPQHRVVGEHEPGVEEDRRAALVEQHGVHPDLPEPAQRHHAQRHPVSPPPPPTRGEDAFPDDRRDPLLHVPPLISPGASGGSTRTTSRAGRNRAPPLGIARYPPSMNTGTSGAPASRARRNAPVLNPPIAPSRVRLPSGKTTSKLAGRKPCRGLPEHAGGRPAGPPGRRRGSPPSPSPSRTGGSPPAPAWRGTGRGAGTRTGAAGCRRGSGGSTPARPLRKGRFSIPST